MDILLVPVFIIVILLLPILALALALYAIPLRAIAVLRYGNGRNEQEITIAWGIISVRVAGAGQEIGVFVFGQRVFLHTLPREPGSDEAREPPAPEEFFGPGGMPEPGEIIHTVHRMIGPIAAFGSVLWQQTRFEELRGTVTIGLGNPALTGELYGGYWASRFILVASRIVIDLVPDFDRAVLVLDITIRERLDHPLLALIAASRLARSISDEKAAMMAGEYRTGVAGA
jgi:hypothetical protein